MASPALASNHDALDPQRKAQYTIQIPQDLLDGRSNATSYSSVRFNHKPSNSGTARSTRLKSTSQDSVSLDIKDKRTASERSSTYHYEGTKSSPKESFVLMFDPDTQSATLQPIKSSYSFNLKSTPTNSSSTQLAEQYPQLHESNESTELAANNELASSMLDDEPDEDNPFDFRHFLDGAKASSRMSPSPAPPARISTPRISDSVEHSSPAARERAASAPEGKSKQQQQQHDQPPRIRVQRKATDDTVSSAASSRASKSSLLQDQKKKQQQQITSSPASKQIPRSIKPTDSHEFDLLDTATPAADTDSSPTAAAAAALTSTLTDEDDADDDDDDDDFMNTHSSFNGLGGLEIDFGDEGPPAPLRSRARAITLPGSSRGGPISLRSAANSPGSQVQTPQQQPRRPRGLRDIEEDEDVIDLGGAFGGAGARHVRDDDDELNEEDNADVSSDEEGDQLPLSRPAHHSARSSRSAAAPVQENGEDDDNDDNAYDHDVEPMQLDLQAHDLEMEEDDNEHDLGQDDGWTAGSARLQESESESEAE